MLAGLRNIPKRHFYHALFAVTLICLIALAIWWSFFIRRSIIAHYDFQMLELKLNTRILAMQTERSVQKPVLGPMKQDYRFEIVNMKSAREECSDALARWKTLSICPTEKAVLAIEEKYRSQQTMWFGEGGLLLLLLLVSVFMLHRLVIVEIRRGDDNDRFLDLVTHELKTPLAGIRALLQSISMGTVPNDKLKGMVGMGMHEIDRLEHEVENILTRNRLHSPEYRLNVTPMKLRETVERILEHRTIFSKSQRCATLGEGKEVLAFADSDALRIIIENLLDNAMKYGEKEKPSYIEVQNLDQWACISVKDFGIGIEPKHLETVFEPYFRESDRGGAVKHGSGLGLHISRSLANRLGGSLMARSEGKGKGTTFTLRLKKVVQ